MAPSEHDIRTDLDHRFAHHVPPNKSVGYAHNRIREAMRAAAASVHSLVPVSREHSLAMTKLEEAMMWANAGIARAGTRAARNVNNGVLILHGETGSATENPASAPGPTEVVPATAQGG